MKTLVNVARYHLVDRVTYLALPWGIMTFSFLVNVVIDALVPPTPHGYYTGGLVTIYVFLLICGALSMTRALPFGLMLGVSRRTYYLGTALLVAVLGVVYGLGLTVLQVVERASGGWGFRLHFFRIPWIMDGPWYETWLTSFVLLVLFFLYGMWYGLVFRRWSVLGLVAFIAAQILVALLVVVAVSLTHDWSAVGHFFTTVTALALTGVLAVVAAAMGLGGLITIRRVTV
ncbi:MAG: ABC transporter permease [Pseudonocardiales bacterium]|nr:MAG: ABC transporter permease [Pseudonocardiales bacterium]